MNQSDYFIWAGDALQAYKIHNKLKGVKRSKTPNIHELTDEESRLLEEKITSRGISLNQARKRGYREK